MKAAIFLLCLMGLIIPINASDDQSTDLTFTVPESYKWSAPSDITFTPNAENETMSGKVSVAENIIANNTSLVISISPDQRFVLTSAEGIEKEFKVRKNGVELSSGDEVLEMISGTNSGEQSLDFSIVQSVKIAGTFKGTVNFTAKLNLGAGINITIGSKKYTVIENVNNDQYLVIERDSIGNIQYQPNQNGDGSYNVGSYAKPNTTRYDGEISNLYEGSYIDSYLNTTYFNTLSAEIQNAIVDTTIKQNFYSQSGSNPLYSGWGYKPGTSEGEQTYWYNEGTEKNPNWVKYDEHIPQDGEEGRFPLRIWTKQDKGNNSTVANEITRKIFLPSIEEVSKVVNLSDELDVYNFVTNINGSQSHLWLRDSQYENANYALGLSYSIRSLDYYSVVNVDIGVRPAYVLDLSKVAYTVE